MQRLFELASELVNDQRMQAKRLLLWIVVSQGDATVINPESSNEQLFQFHERHPSTLTEATAKAC